jgi:hypothetical protein
VQAATPSGGWEDPDETLASQLGDELREPSFEAEDLFEELREQQADEELGGALYPFADALYVRDSDELQRRTRALVQEWSERSSPGTVAVELRFGRLARGDADAWLTAEAPHAPELLATLDRRLMWSERVRRQLFRSQWTKVVPSPTTAHCLVTGRPAWKANSKLPAKHWQRHQHPGSLRLRAITSSPVDR